MQLTTREQRILDWHFLRMKLWGVAIPALFIGSFKPVHFYKRFISLQAPRPHIGIRFRTSHPGYYFMFIIWPVGLTFWVSASTLWGWYLRTDADCRHL